MVRGDTDRMAPELVKFPDLTFGEFTHAFLDLCCKRLRDGHLGRGGVGRRRRTGARLLRYRLLGRRLKHPPEPRPLRPGEVSTQVCPTSRQQPSVVRLRYLVRTAQRIPAGREFVARAFLDQFRDDPPENGLRIRFEEPTTFGGGFGGRAGAPKPREGQEPPALHSLLVSTSDKSVFA